MASEDADIEQMPDYDIQWPDMGDGYVAKTRMAVLDVEIGERFNTSSGRGDLGRGTHLTLLNGGAACPSLQRLDGRGGWLDGSFVPTDRSFGTCHYIDRFAQVGATEIVVSGDFAVDIFQATQGGEGLMVIGVTDPEEGWDYDGHSFLFMRKLSDGSYDASMFRDEPERKSVTKEEYMAEREAFNTQNREARQRVERDQGPAVWSPE